MTFLRRFAPLAASLVLALLVFAPVAATGAPASSGKPTELLLKLAPGADLDGVLATYDGYALQTVSGGAARQLSGDANITRVAYADDAAALRALAQLRHHPAVLVAELEQGRELFWEPDDEPDYDLQEEWVEQVNLPAAWNISTGNDTIVVGVVDSGVSPTHPDFEDKLVSGYNAVDGDENWADNNGHGTHVAGIIAASGSNAQGTAGVAMDVKIMPVRVLDDENFISTASIADGIMWAVDNGADVINLSFGAQSASTIEQEAVQYAYNANVPVLAASGNYTNRISYPASYPEAISVGALDSSGNRAVFSSVISEVDLAAPGVLIYSPHWSPAGDGWTNVLNNQPVSGTSFAVAIASGVTALLRSVNGDLGPEDVRSVLTSTAVDSGEPGNEAGVGAGQLDAEAALRSVAFAAMFDTWFPTDSPVAGGAVQRTWLWGEDPPPYFAYESYAEAQHGVRLVYYYDKSRMEITDPFDDRAAVWYVTNGLLVNELITGRVQVGDGDFIDREPAAVNVAGDPDDTLGPTYATFSEVLDADPVAENLPISQTITRDGDVGADPLLISYGVVGAYLDETTGHRVANVFWDYLNSTGPIATNEGLVDGPLFEPWFFATGLPVTEAYWAEVKVAGVVQDVLMQCFERRCLTYTPSNPLAWRVEMGNVGLHYYAWRYDDESQPPIEPPEDPDAPARGELIFEAGFEVFGSAEIDAGSRTVVEEGYLIEVDNADAEIGALIPQLTVEDVIVTGTVRFLDAEAGGAFCVVSRFVHTAGVQYRACIGANGDVSLLYGEEPLIVEAGYVQPAEMSAGVQISILSSGSSHWLEVNGEIVGYAEHEGAAVGSAGLVGVGDGVFLVINYAVYAPVVAE